MTEVSFIMAKICDINFWIENEPPLPPPSELFRKFIRFGGGRLPLYHLLFCLEHYGLEAWFPCGPRQVFVLSPFKPSQSEMSAAARNLGGGAGSQWEGKVQH